MGFSEQQTKNHKEVGKSVYSIDFWAKRFTFAMYPGHIRRYVCKEKGLHATSPPPVIVLAWVSNQSKKAGRYSAPQPNHK